MESIPTLYINNLIFFITQLYRTPNLFFSFCATWLAVFEGAVRTSALSSLSMFILDTVPFRELRWSGNETPDNLRVTVTGGSRVISYELRCSSSRRLPTESGICDVLLRIWRVLHASGPVRW